MVARKKAREELSQQGVNAARGPARRAPAAYQPASLAAGPMTAVVGVP